MKLLGFLLVVLGLVVSCSDSDVTSSGEDVLMSSKYVLSSNSTVLSVDTAGKFSLDYVQSKFITESKIALRVLKKDAGVTKGFEVEYFVLENFEYEPTVSSYSDDVEVSIVNLKHDLYKITIKDTSISLVRHDTTSAYIFELSNKNGQTWNSDDDWSRPRKFEWGSNSKVRLSTGGVFIKNNFPDFNEDYRHLVEEHL